jgi:demethylmenaquinone methyltransferase/2-methoxy-6-polyprenyl-1,4-benzoquinol methylase
VTRAGLDRDPADVAAMFDAVAPRYDLVNDLLSMGQDRLWRRAVVRLADVHPGERVLDLAAGTGMSSQPFARAGAQVVAADFSPGMLAAGRRHRPGLSFTAADAVRLPFRDAGFDLATCSFGLRNVTDVDRALRELARVTRPGGRLVLCEFSRPRWPVLRLLYGAHLRYGLPLVARLASSNPVAYRYLSESIGAWPDQAGLAARIAVTGWADVHWRDLSGGIVAVHLATRPS